MEPITLASSFATIVSLLGQFCSERSAESQAGFSEFSQWLIETQHQDLKKLLELNTNATISIKALLDQDKDILLDRINKLDNALASYASSLEGFSELAGAINPEAVLSSQALDVLRQFEKSGASKLIRLKTTGPISFLFLDANGELEIEEPRFIEDDLSTLIDLGLLREDYNSNGDTLYVYTRAASRLVNERKNDS